MKKNYKHLTLEERELIAIYKAEGKSKRAIAKLLGRNHTTISREVQRNKNSAANGYLPNNAHKTAKGRKQKAGEKYRLKNPYIRDYVHRCLALQWSPELIAGRLALEHPDHSISYEAIYQYIYNETPQLIPHLARGHRKRYKKNLKRKTKKTKIPNRTSILERPAEINNRAEFGHWESDSIVSRHNTTILNVLIERLSRYTIITKLNGKTAHLSQRAIKLRLVDLPSDACQSITYDNGTENVLHEQVNAYLNCSSYFCEPYHSWEKGSVENVNGLIRRFFPKKTNLAKLHDYNLARVQFWINNRPKKCLNFKTPAEVFFRQCGKIPAQF